ncbi:MAG: ROK family protein [Phycisphaerales bacterium]
MARHVIGIDLGGTHMQLGLVNATGQIVARERQLTHADECADAVLASIASGVESLAKGQGMATGDIEAIGIGAPGAIDLEGGVVLEAPNLRWSDFPLGRRLSERLDGRPVIVENDVNVAILGEQRLGAGRGSDDVLGVWVGTGIGGGIIIGGRLHRGAFGTAGEIGQTILFPGGAMGHRVFEDVCSRKSTVDRIVELMHSNRQSSLHDLCDGDTDRIDIRMVAKAYASGDELVKSLVDETARFIGISIANVLSVLSLSRVVLGGGMTEALGDPFVNGVADAMRAFVFPSSTASKIEVRPTELADNAGLLGAAMLALERADG